MTLNELRAALDKLVAERPECGAMPVFFDDDEVGPLPIGSVEAREQIEQHWCTDELPPVDGVLLSFGPP